MWACTTPATSWAGPCWESRWRCSSACLGSGRWYRASRSGVRRCGTRSSAAWGSDREPTHRLDVDIGEGVGLVGIAKSGRGVAGDQLAAAYERDLLAEL